MPYTDSLAAYGEYSTDGEKYSGTQAFIQPPAPEKVPSNNLEDQAGKYYSIHKKNPVAWNTLSHMAGGNIPILLTMGYYANHWCHVMNRDCWSDAETAGMMNATCHAVIADREEYPALDAIMTIYCRLQNGTSGYPLNIFLDPETLQPFFCTTWLPKRTMGQMPGMTEILPRIRWLWTMQRSDVDRARSELSQKMTEHIAIISGLAHKSSARIGKVAAYEAVDDLRRIFDVRYGGFGSGGKFPEGDKLMFLLDMGGDNSVATKNDRLDSRTMTDVTLRRMWRGGIHDHLGGGFAASSSDSQWLVADFEKRLEPNAMILLAASKSERITTSSFHRLLADDIIFSLTKDFADDATYSQCYRSSILGDTPDGEGRYYLWSEDEIKSVLADDAGLFSAAYGVLPSGNFSSEITGAMMGWNILYEASTVTELSRRYGIKGNDVATRLYDARKKLLDYRDKRNPLMADNKAVMSGNGLVIASMSHASVTFDTREWHDFAERTALFMSKNFRDKSGEWCHMIVDGKISGKASCTDIAYFLWGIVELYAAAKHFNAGEKQLGEWRELIKALADTMIENFGDDKAGGLFLTRDAVMGIRLKTAEDMNSLPGYNAVAAIILCEVAFILEDRKYSDFSRGIIGCFSRYVRENALSCLTMITADMTFKAFKPAPKPTEPPAKIPTDEELNREEPSPETEQEQPKARSSRRTQSTPRSTERSTDRPQRRTRTHRRQ